MLRTHEGDEPHFHEWSAESRQALAQALWQAENVELTTVGIDIGSSTSHLMFSRVHLQRKTQLLSSEFAVVGREVLWRSPILFTPFLADDTIDAERLRAFVDAAYVQAGDVQVELVTQHDDTPSAFRDMFARDGQGLHHVAVMPDDYDALVAAYRDAGYPVATELRTAAGRGAAYVDTRPLLGHMLEIYRVSDSLLALYSQVAEAAAHWDGRQLVVEVDPRR